MPQNATISRDELKQHIERDDVTVIEVLDAEKYEQFHLPGARNVPLADDFEQRVQQAVPDKKARVVVYCYDNDCDASEKAATMMRDLGYQNVYDYEEGKVGWKEAGLPIEQ